MRIKNKYLRNRHAKRKLWNRVRNRQQPYKTYMPYYRYKRGGVCVEHGADEQVADHFQWIEQEARDLDNGHHKVFFRNASADYRRTLNKIRKAKERHALARMNMGDYEMEFPQFKRDAAWNYW